MDIEETIQETFSNYHMGVVLILLRKGMDNAGVYVSTGSGFVVGKRESCYLVMTCKHCIVSAGDNVKLSVRLPGKTIEYEVEKLYDSDDSDIAMIIVKDVPDSEECPVLKFGDLDDMTPNADIVQLGYVIESASQLILNPAVAPGTIVACFQNGCKGMKNIIYTAAGKIGTSGAPVLFNYKVIGVFYAISVTDQISFAVSSNTVRIAMRSWLKLPPQDETTFDQMIDGILAKIS